MGIFSSLPASVGEKTDKTVIAKGTRITGAIHTDALLMIDGSMEGEIQSSSDVSIGLNGRYSGKLSAKHVLVSGQVDGDIRCDRLEVLKSGVVNGDVLVRELTIEAGGRFFGQSREAAPDAPPELALVSPLRPVKEVAPEEPLKSLSVRQSPRTA